MGNQAVSRESGQVDEWAHRMSVFRNDRPRIPENVEAKLTADWIKLRYALRDGEATDDFLWAVDFMNELIDQNPVECLRVIQRILSHDQSEFIAANLGSGPIEDLLRIYGKNALEQIERMAAADENFKKTLRSVWVNSFPEEIKARWLKLVS